MSKDWRAADRDYVRSIQRMRHERSLAEELQQMAEEEMQEVFIIENEWASLYGDSGHENVSVHLTLQDAEEALWAKAEELGVELAESDVSFNLYDSASKDSDIYYIGSYVVGDRG